MWNVFKIYKQNKEKEQYRKIRIEAEDALKSGDRKRYIVLNAIADKMIDRVISF